MSISLRLPDDNVGMSFNLFHPPVEVETGENNVNAQCWGFMGAAGGVGVTSLCIELTHGLIGKSQQGNCSVCLIDLDFENGACASYLDIIPIVQLTDLQDDASRIDKALIEALTATHKSGLNLLAMPNTLNGNDLVNPDAVVAMLDAACQMFDYIILDIPRLWRPWTHAAIGAADYFGLVTEMNIPTLHATRSRAADVEQSVQLSRPVSIIINKFERRAFRNSVKITDAERVLKRPVSATICSDADIVREAVNCGMPSGAIRSNSRFSKDCRNFAEQSLRARNPQNIQKIA